jgi:hypothetical protein
MPNSTSSGGPARTSLRARLERLQATIDGLGERLRNGIARAVSQAVSSAVHDAIHFWLGDGKQNQATAGPMVWPSPHLRRQWDDRPEDRWPGDYEDDRFEDDRWEDEPYFEGAGLPQQAREPPPQPSSEQKPSWRSALALGLQATAWCLRRSKGRLGAHAAFGIGLVTFVATFGLGPATLAAVAVTASTLGLLSLSEAAGQATGFAATASP